MTEPLAWGRQYLMCPPQHFGVLYEINPRMHAEVQVEPEVATRQWHDPVSNLRGAGAEVVTMDPHPDVPDLVSGCSFRSDAAAIPPLAALLGCPVRSVQLVDERLHHIDLTFCPLDDRHAICAPV